jgi:hypothetical protein
LIAAHNLLKLPSVATSNELLHGHGIVADTEVSADTIVQSTGHLRGRKEVHMKTTRIMAVVLPIVGSGEALSQQPGIKRTDLQRHDLACHSRISSRTVIGRVPGPTGF